MNIRTLLLPIAVAGCLVLASAAGAAAPEQAQSPETAPIEFLDGEFILVDSSDAAVKPAPGNIVPLVEGQKYAWFIRIRTTRKQVHWREEFTLPQAPESWGEAGKLGTRKLSGDSRTSITERTVDAGKGVILNAWSVAKGDPPGKYRIRVFIDDKLVNTFDFELR